MSSIPSRTTIALCDTCPAAAAGVERWIDTKPKPGAGHDDSSPAPAILILPKR